MISTGEQLGRERSNQVGSGERVEAEKSIAIGHAEWKESPTGNDWLSDYLGQLPENQEGKDEEASARGGSLDLVGFIWPGLDSGFIEHSTLCSASTLENMFRAIKMYRCFFSFVGMYLRFILSEWPHM